MEILLQEEHLCNATFVALLQSQSLWPMFKIHLHTNMILVLETPSSLNISKHALLMTSSLAIVF